MDDEAGDTVSGDIDMLRGDSFMLVLLRVSTLSESLLIGLDLLLPLLACVLAPKLGLVLVEFVDRRRLVVFVEVVVVETLLLSG